eukprot:748720-Hanusia_phi.AAC.1
MMDMLLQKEGVDLRITTYKASTPAPSCLTSSLLLLLLLLNLLPAPAPAPGGSSLPAPVTATSTDNGLVEWVEDCFPLSAVLAEHDNDIRNFFKKYGKDENAL